MNFITGFMEVVNSRELGVCVAVTIFVCCFVLLCAVAVFYGEKLANRSIK